MQENNENDMSSPSPIVVKANKNTIWTHILEVLKINTDLDFQYITSAQIKACKSSWNGSASQFEPRLICKMDTSDSRPEIFKEHNISIISVKNGKYLLFKGSIYITLPKIISVPNIIKNSNSIVLSIGNSESNMLDLMRYGDIFDDIIGEPVMYGPIHGGRHRVSFDTRICDNNIEVRGSQYETDGCYETENYICVVEAKLVEIRDFNIRQLYYPYRAIHNQCGNQKKIISLFIHKDKKGVIHVHKYIWNNPGKMLDIEHIGYYSYYL